MYLASDRYITMYVPIYSYIRTCTLCRVDIPRSLLTKGLVLKGSISSMCSPVPMNVMGLLVAATLCTLYIHVHVHLHVHVRSLYIYIHIQLNTYIVSCAITLYQYMYVQYISIIHVHMYTYVELDTWYD